MAPNHLASNAKMKTLTKGTVTMVLKFLIENSLLQHGTQKVLKAGFRFYFRPRNTKFFVLVTPVCPLFLFSA